MGQKVNPIGLRLGISKTWNSKWFAEKDYAEQLKQDLDIQSFVVQLDGTTNGLAKVVASPARRWRIKNHIHRKRNDQARPLIGLAKHQ